MKKKKILEFLAKIGILEKGNKKDNKRKSKKFREVLRWLVGGIKKEKITTYNDSGDIIKVETVTTKLSYFTIIAKLFIGLMIVLILLAMFSKLYSCFLFRYSYSYFCNPISFFISIMFLMFFIWLYSKLE